MSKIFVEEILHSPKITYGQTPSIETKLRIFPEPGNPLESVQVFRYAMEWLAKHPVEKITEFQRLFSVEISPLTTSDGSCYEVTIKHSKWKTKTTTFKMESGNETAKRYFGIVKDAAGTIMEPLKVPDFYGGINFQNNEFQGIDVPIPGAVFSITTCYPWEFLTADYCRLLTMYRGCVNQEEFLYFAPEEVLFLGASITMEEEILNTGARHFFWRIKFDFKASPNVTGLTNNNTLAPINKKGWEVYWIYSVEKQQEAAQRVIKFPIAHYAIQVAAPVNFAALCIPDFRVQIQG